MAPNDSYAIVVEVGPVPQPETCLICIDFGPEFQDISRAIHDAANAIGLRPVRLDSLAQGKRISQAIVRHTRAASLVVAVCSPQDEAGADGSGHNPNVMFELGLATALGKPLVLLTTDPSKLPVDIRDIAAVEYNPRGDPQALKDRVETQMRRVLREMGKDDLFVFPNEEGIWVARARHRMLLTPAFWRSFRLVFAYASNLRKEVELIHREYAHELGIHAQQILEGPSAGPKLRELWRRYMTRYADYTAEAFIEPQGLREALGRLHELGAPTESGPQIQRIDSYSSAVQTAIGKFQRAHQETAQAFQNLQSRILTTQGRADVSGYIVEFVEKVRSLAILSSGLVDRVVEVVVSGFEDEGAAEAGEAAIGRAV